MTHVLFLLVEIGVIILIWCLISARVKANVAGIVSRKEPRFSRVVEVVELLVIFAVIIMLDFLVRPAIGV